jgi:glycosyltransferase involved in cell wall biosynthesis
VNSKKPAEIIFAIRHELRYFWPAFTANVNLSLRRRVFNKWIRHLTEHPPEVLAGANIDRTRGIRQHLLGLKSHSTFNVELAPPDAVLDRLSYHDLSTTFRQEFFDFKPAGISTLHSHVFPYFVEWCAANRECGSQWIHTYHAPYLPEYAKGELEPWQMEINRAGTEVARDADVRISVSRWQRDYLSKTHRIETIYVPNGIDVSFCDKGDAARFHREFGRSNFVLWVGCNDPVKNPADFVRIAQGMPEVDFVMIGDGLDPETMAVEWDVIPTSNLVFTGQLPRLAVQDALAACATLVVTSKREGLPTVVLEALSHSRPVVIPNDPGCLEAAGNLANVFVFEHHNLDEAVARTKEALSYDGTDRVAARERVLDEFDWKVVGRQLDSFYRSGVKRY